MSILIKNTTLFISIVILSSCSSMQPDQLDFAPSGMKNTSDRLTVPPDMTGLSTQDKYHLPGGAVRASEYQQTNRVNANGAVLTKIEGVHIERAGQQRWLVVEHQSPDKLWSTLYSFWQNMGFIIDKEEQAIGFMETSWAENKANIPGDPIRNFLTKVGLGGAYSSSTRDKFIIRIEPDDSNGSIITFTNQRREEVFTGRDKQITKWVAKPSDQNLEAQLLARYMLSLGYTKDKVSHELNKPQENLLATLDKSVLILKGEHKQNKYRLKLALGRIGFNILDHNKESDIFIVSPMLDHMADKAHIGFMDKIFGRHKNKHRQPNNQLHEKIEISIASQGQQSVIKVCDSHHQPHQKQDIILNQLYLELR